METWLILEYANRGSLQVQREGPFLLHPGSPSWFCGQQCSAACCCRPASLCWCVCWWQCHTLACQQQRCRWLMHQHAACRRCWSASAERHRPGLVPGGEGQPRAGPPLAAGAAAHRAHNRSRHGVPAQPRHHSRRPVRRQRAADGHRRAPTPLHRQGEQRGLMIDEAAVLRHSLACAGAAGSLLADTMPA